MEKITLFNGRCLEHLQQDGAGNHAGSRGPQAGVVPMDTAAVASELQQTWNREDAAEWAEIYYSKIPLAYPLQVESYGKARRL